MKAFVDLLTTKAELRKKASFFFNLVNVFDTLLKNLQFLSNTNKNPFQIYGSILN